MMNSTDAVKGSKTKPISEAQARNERFVKSVISICAKDKGQAARLRRSDNPTTEYECWEVLARFGINLEYEEDRLAHVLVIANIAKDKLEKNGKTSLGQAVANCFDDGNQSKQGVARIRRLLACDDLQELTLILRPLLSLIRSRTNSKIDYAQFLSQLRQFRFDPNRVKARWAQDFYHTGSTEG